MQKDLFIWLHCFGTWNPQRQAAELVGYSQYVQAFVEAVAVLQERVVGITVVGGMQDEEGLLEAASTLPEVERRLKQKGIELPLAARTDLVTTISIVRACIAEIEQGEKRGVSPLLFVDTVRLEVTKWLVQYFLNKSDLQGEAEKIVVALPRFDVHSQSTIQFQEKRLQELKEKGVEAVEREILEKRENAGRTRKA